MGKWKDYNIKVGVWLITTCACVWGSFLLERMLGRENRKASW